jgi:ribosomal peptide maturation radical SAM protein 1
LLVIAECVGKGGLEITEIGWVDANYVHILKDSIYMTNSLFGSQRQMHFSERTSPLENNQPAKVALIYMPFGGIKVPHLGISLLKPTLMRHGVPCDVHYLNLYFASKIGAAMYNWICSTRRLLGEWFFASDLFNETWTVIHPIFDNLADEFPRADVPLADIEQMLLEARAGVGEYMENCLSSIPWEQYKIIGFSSTYQQNVASLALAKRIKAAWMEKVIVFGGANCEGEMGLELHRQFPFIDYVCRGEGDHLFPVLVKHILSGAPPPNLPGLISRDKDGSSVPIGVTTQPVKDLDSLPYPDFDDYFEQMKQNGFNLKDVSWLVAETSRGCWYGQRQQCRFCGLCGETTAFRSKSPECILEEISHLTQRHKLNQVQFADNIMDIRFLDTLIPMIIERGDEWSLLYDVKVNLRKDQLRLLKQAGVDILQPGIESLSTSVLKLMRKGCTALQNVQFLKWASELGIMTAWKMLWGFPGEDPDEYTRMADMIPALVHLQPPIIIGPMRLVRFSPYFNDAVNSGFVNIRPAAEYRAAYDLGEENLQRLAYVFNFDFADGRDPATYTAPMIEKLEYWQDNYCPGALTSMANGQALIIYDRRPGAKSARVELTSADKAIYEYCDQAHAFQSILRHLLSLGYNVNENELHERLDQWVDDWLMLSDKNWYLSLAVRADNWVEQASESEVIRQALAKISVKLVDEFWKEFFQ